jgi:hypothetical protein
MDVAAIRQRHHSCVTETAADFVRIVGATGGRSNLQAIGVTLMLTALRISLTVILLTVSIPVIPAPLWYFLVAVAIAKNCGKV